MTENIDQISYWVDAAGQMSIEYIPRIVGAIIIYLVGKWLIHWTSKAFAATMDKRRMDPSLKTFLVSSIRIGLFVLLLLAVIGLIGVPIVGFAAVIAGMAFGVGSALNGSLGNVAGGIMILLTRPFSIGDLIKAQGEFGVVEEIGIIHTTILTSQNQTLHLPNGPLSTGVINNFTKQENLRIDLKVGVQHGTDINKARAVAIEAMQTHPLVLKVPAPDVKVTKVADSGIVFVLWPRIKVKEYDAANMRQMEADYYSVYFGIQELVKKAFQQNGIDNPTSQLQVDMKKD